MKKKKHDPWMMSTLVLAGFIVGFITGNLYGTAGNFGSGSGVEIVEAPSAAAPAIKLSGRKGGTDPVLGDEDAPIVIEEFSDYQCPFCAKFFKNTMGQLEEEYVETGKVRIVYKDYPLSFHKNAAPAAVAAYCAGEQKNYWGMHDALFLNLDMWSGASDPNPVFVNIAKALKLNTKKFSTCLASGDYDDLISQNQAEGVQKGVTGTPAFFVNGQKIVGAQPFSAFKAIIDAELAE